MVLSGLAFAGDNIRQFSSELLLFESKQVVQSEPFRYSDPEHGPALRKLLDVNRAVTVVNELLEPIIEGEFGLDTLNQLDAFKQFVPLAKRYKNAFSSRPADFEAEYLDALTVMVVFLNAQRRFIQHSAEQITKMPVDTLTEEEKAFMPLIRGILDVVEAGVKLMERELFKQAVSGPFSSLGHARVYILAQHLKSGSISAPPVLQPMVKP